MSGNKKSHDVNYMTILFLMVFILMRVVQYYAPVPTISRRNDKRHYQILKINLDVKAHHVEKLMDKGIIEFKEDHLVPAIKFTGIFLYVLLVGFLTSLFIFKDGTYCTSYVIYKSRGVNLLCSFRL